MLAVRVELAVLAYRINLIDEDDRRFIFRGLTEKLPDPLGPDTHEDLGKIAAVDAEEIGFGFAGNRFGEHCLASSRRAD